MLDQARDLQAGGLAALIERRPRGEGQPARRFLTPEQRRLFDETQRVMSLLEGFSDWVMDEVGAQVLPNVRTIRDRFEARRSAAPRHLDRLVARVTGLDLKLEQYRRGEKFVVGCRRSRRHARRSTLLWSGPGRCPRERRWPILRRGCNASRRRRWHFQTGHTHVRQLSTA